MNTFYIIISNVAFPEQHYSCPNPKCCDKKHLYFQTEQASLSELVIFAKENVEKQAPNIGQHYSENLLIHHLE